MELKDAWKHYENTKDTSHGVEHIKAVLDNARIIARNYKELNPEDVEYAAVLHDIAREGDHLHGTNDHEIRGVSMALPYIEHLGLHRQNDITDAIANHRSNGKPTTLLGRVISDADRLDSVHRIPNRSYEYYRSLGNSDYGALRASYWNLRHSKLRRLQGRTANFYTHEGKERYLGQVAELEKNTRTFKDYLKYIDGVDKNMEFNTKVASFNLKMASIAFNEKVATFLSKTAGVGFDVHGYEKTPEDMQALFEAEESGASDKAEKEHWAMVEGKIGKVPKRDDPKFTRRTGLFKKEFDNDAYTRALNEWSMKSKQFDHLMPPEPINHFDIRVKTPHDLDINYKFNGNMSYYGANLEKYYTDQCYGDPIHKPMTKVEAKDMLTEYNRAASAYLKDNNIKDDKHVKAFNDKVNYLIKHPKVKTIRLEWE